MLTGLAALSSAFVSGCLEVDPHDRVWSWLMQAETINRWFTGGLASPRGVKTYPASAISTDFKINSLNLPDSQRMAALHGWQSWRLQVDGLVRRPVSLALGDLQRLPSVSQITRLDCVEGWSAIAQWTGCRFADLLDRVGVLPGAKYAVCYSADQDDGGTPFYGSLDLRAANHPNTLLAYGFNGQTPMPVDRGAPLRLVLPTQLGYKNTKFLYRISLVPDFSGLGGGKGGYWEDQGYEWYGGI
jgi:DMSO/TMAO reductase YedYZ molybdopterin-dependent catalytic subunit